MKTLILALFAALALAAPAAGQQTDSARAALWLRGVCPGREVQISTTWGERVRGRCAPIESTQLRLTGDAREQVVPFAGIDSLWVRQRGSGSGAGIGALLGALAGGGAALLLSQGLCESEDGCVNDTLVVGMGAAATLGTVGALLGGAVGHMTRVWRRIYPQ
ncbi:MAG TPA: hypothetical protein VF006_11075 [Longimicrobium sp.]